MEVYFRARGDFQVVHEPFADSYWKGASVEDKLEELLGMIKTVRSALFVKDIAHHLPLEIARGARLIESFTHIILVRSPLPTFHSHLKVNPEVQDQEFGYQALHNIFRAITETTGKSPQILLADDILEDAEAAIERFCDMTEIVHLPQALRWQAQEQADWKAAQKWQVKAANSTSFEKRTARELPPLPTRLEKTFEHHEKYYLKLLEAAARQDQREI